MSEFGVYDLIALVFPKCLQDFILSCAFLQVSLGCAGRTVFIAREHRNSIGSETSRDLDLYSAGLESGLHLRLRSFGFRKVITVICFKSFLL